MARPALTEEQRREIRRRIRAAASELYAINGLEKISARAIADKAGVSVGTIYSHFNNLPELMQSLWRQPVRRLVRNLEAIAASDSDAKERLMALLTEYANFAKAERAVYRGAFMFVRPDSHVRPKAVPIEEAGISKAFIAVIAEGQEQGLFRSGDPVHHTELLWASLHGSITLPDNVDRVDFPSNALSDQMINLLMEWICC